MSILGKILGLEKNVFGLDIGYENIKVVELRKTGSMFKLVSFGCSPSPKEPFAKEKIKDKKALANAIVQAVSNHHISAKSVVSALPESLVFTKIIQLPKMRMEELQSVVPNEAANFIPLEPTQTYLDFQVVGEANNNYEVLVVAAPKTLVNDFIETLKMAGLSPFCLETKPLANTRALIPKNAQEAVLILDLGALATSLTIYDNGAIKFTVTFPLGGQIFTEKIAATLSIKMEEAEEKKKTLGLTKAGEQIKKGLEEPLGVLIDETASGLNYYKKYNEKAKISKIILTGGGAAMPGLCSFLENKIGIKTEVGNPWQAIKNPPKEKQTVIFTAAIGMAMRQE